MYSGSFFPRHSRRVRKHFGVRDNYETSGYAVSN